MIMHIGFSRMQSFHENIHFAFQFRIVLMTLVLLMGRLVARIVRIVAYRRTDRQTDGHTHRLSSVTLAVHAHLGLMTQ